MSLSNYVPDLDDIRALLGVSVEELENDTISLRVYERNLEESLIDLDPEMIGDYQEVESIEAPSRTEAQRRFFNALQSYATYHVAVDLAGALPQFSPRLISDSKASVQRHNDPYQKTIEAVERGFAKATERLKQRYGALKERAVAEITTVPVFVASVPTADPVTGS